MSDKFIGQIFSDEDLEKVVDLLKNKDFSGWFGNNCGGLYMQELEQKFAKFCGTKNAYTTSSGSSAIYTALRAVGVGKGDLVAVPTFTHIGSVAPIVLCGARPYFIDVEPVYGTIDPEDLRNVGRTFKAILVQHFLGMPCKMKEIRDVVGDAYIVEDASLGLGSSYYGDMVGSLGDIAAFSIGGGRTKIICAGEGGIVTTNNPELAEKAMNVRNHGDRYSGKLYFGFNFRMCELNALVALCQMNKIDSILDWQIKNAEYILDKLPIALTSPPKSENEIKTNHYIIHTRFREEVSTIITRNEWLKKLTSDEVLNIGRGIPRRSVNGGYGTLIHEVNFYKQFDNRKYYPNSEKLRDEIVWIDWHRYPRTIFEINQLLKVMKSIA